MGSYSNTQQKKFESRRMIKEFFLFPKTIAKRYGRMIMGFKKMSSGWPELTKKMDAYIKSYSRLVDICVRVPIVIGIILSAIGFFTVYRAMQKIPISDIIKYDISSKKYTRAEIKLPDVPTSMKKMNKRLSHFGGFLNLAIWSFPIGYILGYAGAIILSRNPIFIESDKVRDALERFKYLNLDGKPWDFVYTPDVILFEAYGITPQSFKDNRNFWSTINFAPTNPSSLISNINTFCVKKAAQLPPSINFDSISTFPSLEELRSDGKNKQVEPKPTGENQIETGKGDFVDAKELINDLNDRAHEYSKEEVANKNPSYIDEDEANGDPLDD